jgi:urea transport system substrate-binding protein
LRDACADVTIGADISPEGEIRIDPENFNTHLVPKIGQCQSDGSFVIVKEAPEPVAPDPYSIYSDIGTCTSAGLLAPDGTLREDVI